MKALVVTDEGFKYIDKELRKLRMGEVLIKIKACGICGSDIPRIVDGKTHFKPIILGHESAGIIYRSQSNKFKEGDKVVIVPLIPCMKCEECIKGDYAGCRRYKFIGSSIDGAMAEYCIVKEDNLLLLPEDFDFIKAACIEPITIGLHAIYRIKNFNINKKIIVFGCGTIGLFLIQSLISLGCKDIIVIDISRKKLEIAKSLGIKNIILSNELGEIDSCADYIFETTGVSSVQSELTKYCKFGGEIVLVGTVHSDINIKKEIFELLLRKEIILTGSWMGYSKKFPGKEWEQAIQFLKNNNIDVSKVITKKYEMKDGVEAIRRRDKDDLKIMLVDRV